MKNKYLLYLLISLMFSGVFVRFMVNQKQKEYDNKKNNVQKIQEDLTELVIGTGELLSGLTNDQIVGNLEDVGTGDIMSGVDFSTGNFNNLTIKQLEDNYTNALMVGDDIAQAQWLEKIYQKTQDSGLLYLILNKYIKIYDYKKSLIYIMKIKEIDPDMKKFGVKPFLNLLFNSLEFTNKNIKDIKTFIKIYKDKGLLTQDDEHFYHGLIALGKLDFDTFNEDFNNINTGGEYKEFVSQINSAYEQFRLYKDVAPYYLNGLFSFVLFENGYYNIAQKLAYDTLKLNDNYILPNQIVAYSSFIMGRIEQSKKYLTKLIEIDFDNSQNYKFLLGISFYWNNKFEDSIVFLTQISQEDYLLDSYRYLMLSYYKIGDYENFKKYLEKLSSINGLNEYDYYTIFDIILFKDYQKTKNFNLYNQNKDLIKKVVIDCYKKSSKTSKLICAYGRGGYYFANGDKEKTLKYFLHLVDYYPRSYFFEIIGDIYAQKNDMNNAKKYYVNAMLFTQDVVEKKTVKDKIITTVMQHKK